MPPRGHSSAPAFNAKDPRELNRYFDEIEIMLNTCEITDDAERKRHATRYVDYDTVEQWRSLPEYQPRRIRQVPAQPPATGMTEEEQEQTYEMWKGAVINLYPGAAEEHRYSLADLDRLVHNNSLNHLQSIAEFADYNRRFMQLSGWLLAHNKIGEIERNRRYRDGIGDGTWNKIQMRLNVVESSVRPGDSYTLEQIKNAAEFSLYGTETKLPGQSHGSEPIKGYVRDHNSDSTSARKQSPKKEDIEVRMDNFENSVLDKYQAIQKQIETLLQQTRDQQDFNRGPRRSPPNSAPG
ncbi:hypothetical protein DXG01_010894, partial [Tephrocybe rancida]